MVRVSFFSELVRLLQFSEFQGKWFAQMIGLG